MIVIESSFYKIQSQRMNI